MADGEFFTELVTPEESLFSGQATAVMASSSVGDFTVLDGHTKLITDIVPSLVRIEQGEETHRFAVHSGYVQVEKAPPEAEGAEGGTRVTILAGIAEAAEAIDVARAEQARGAAEARLAELRSAGRGGAERGAEPGGGAERDPELEEAEAALGRAQLRLEVAGATAGT
jgi:F-type H+-transporting ATPase subunit epsilon